MKKDLTPEELAVAKLTGTDPEVLAEFKGGAFENKDGGPGSDRIGFPGIIQIRDLPPVEDKSDIVFKNEVNDPSPPMTRIGRLRNALGRLMLRLATWLAP